MVSYRQEYKACLLILVIFNNEAEKNIL